MPYLNRQCVFPFEQSEKHLLMGEAPKEKRNGELNREAYIPRRQYYAPSVKYTYRAYIRGKSHTGAMCYDGKAKRIHVTLPICAFGHTRVLHLAETNKGKEKTVKERTKKIFLWRHSLPQHE